MFIHRVKTPGLAHISYVIGSKGKAAVIDPRRDCETYVGLAHGEGARITQIFETHRNEDLVSGASLLADQTGATVWHGPNPAEPIGYTETATEGREVQVGQLRLQVLETPGHTDDSISIVVFDDNYSDGAVGVFTGDALFVGDVGRTDFYPDRAEEVAGLLYDSLQKLQALGDQALLWPAHGAGSVCGSGMADREFSTIGHERANNPRLALARDAFIKAKMAEHHYKPPYFKLMERLNLSAVPPCAPPAKLPPVSWPELEKASDNILDVRDVTSYLGGHLQGVQALPEGMIAAFGGWFLKERQSIGLIAADEAQANRAAAHLCRIGFDGLSGYVTGVLSSAASGASTGTLDSVTTDEVAARVTAKNKGWTLLDVRALEEFESGHVEGAQHIYAGEVLEDPAALKLSGHVTVMCGSGARATLAASALRRSGVESVDVYLGSVGAWTSSGKPLVKE